MTREEAISRLEKIKEKSDTEINHVEADGILCELLVQLGYGDVVAAWGKIDKWYA